MWGAQLGQGQPGEGRGRGGVPSGLAGSGSFVPSSAANPAFPFPVSAADLQLSGMKTLEHVAVTVTITHPRRGNLEIRLFCPSGMMSLIGTARSMDS